jgi:hypothetical protein
MLMIGSQEKGMLKQLFLWDVNKMKENEARIWLLSGYQTSVEGSFAFEPPF